MNRIIVVAPFAGWAVPLDAVPDPVFAERMLGDGLAIDPIDGVMHAPVAGRIASIHVARHAVTIETEGGACLLVHIGLETVALGGAGFAAKVAVGARVAAGDPLIVFDLDAVGLQAKSLVTPVLLTDGAFDVTMLRSEGRIAAGDPLFALVPRGAAEDVAVADSPLVERRVVVPLRHGIHARPAARLAECAKGFDAALEIVAADGRKASLASPVAMLTLALPHGARITLRGLGAEADVAVGAVAALIESGMGEGVRAAVSPETETPSGPLPSSLNGARAAPGMAVGPAWRPPAPALPDDTLAADPDAERGALERALASVRARLAVSAQGEGVAAGIAAAHFALLDDPALRDAADRAIAVGSSAARAWQSAIDGFAATLGATGDRRFAERVDDLRDLALGVRAALAGSAAAFDPPEGAILAAEEVLPSQLMALAGKGLAGIASGGGGPTSHTAIIAAGLGLPMVAVLGPDVTRIATGTMLLLDGDAGTLAIDPPAALVAERRAVVARDAAFSAAAETRAHETAVTSDGVRIEVFANCGARADAEAGVAAGAEGCGLLRTEFAFLDRATPPDEDEQAALYQGVADALAGRPLIARTLDIGADKPVPWLPLAPEENPALGLRGLRIGLARPALLRTQLRALLRVEGDVRIMLPMVIDIGELAAARAILVEEAAALGRAVPPLGVMVETPAAAVLAEGLAESADFLSIGSNDLSQYALAMDRGNPAMAGRLDALHPAVLRLIAMTAAGARSHGRWTGVCGGVAAEAAAVPLLIGLGVAELSVPPAQVAAIKAHVRACDAAACRDLAARALTAPDAASVRVLVEDFRREEAVAA